jgi:hypothetical protein
VLPELSQVVKCFEIFIYLNLTLIWPEVFLDKIYFVKTCSLILVRSLLK